MAGAPGGNDISSAPAIVWFRHDLRLADNPALDAAARRGGPVVPLFVWAPEEEGDWPPGAASRWWLHRSLTELGDELRRIGSRLVLRRGPTRAALQEILRETRPTAVYWNRRYEPAATSRDVAIEAALHGTSVETRSFGANLLFEPEAIRTVGGTPFKVFTPFWRACLAGDEPAMPLTAPAKLPAPPRWPESLPVAALELEPRIPWDAGLRANWNPGAAGAMSLLEQFLDQSIVAYATGRDRPDREGTSRLSPHLHFGEVSPRQVWHAVRSRAMQRKNRDAAGDPFLRQLVWREFAYHLLVHFPHTASQPLRSEFAAFPWASDPAALRAWQRGMTGFPYIDAGMRQLWSTGWMHNRVRMAVASFLVKDLLLPWQAGAQWFWDTLVDADLANNTLGWQWTAGCGADAAPFFRVFNPVGQGEKFDPRGDYVRRWVPELARLPPATIHKPWLESAEGLSAAGIELGRNYPRPIVDHAAARRRALQAFDEVKRRKR